ncbi:hypothetical protein [uncultured Gammaproteobacteria bacterium]|nr:hypothetical protein [uncultured Gammaproteobacteria bacterium]CAC9966604.1 hypothetical protein [uncultured Gammaproteobacteria bacterium]
MHWFIWRIGIDILVAFIGFFLLGFYLNIVSAIIITPLVKILY